MYPYVAVVDDSLILKWAVNRADSVINETPVVIQRRTLLMDASAYVHREAPERKG